MREKPGWMTPSSEEMMVQSTTKATAGPAPFRRTLAKASTLLGLPSGTKSGPGSIIRQMPVKERSNSSMDTDTVPRAGSLSTALSFLNPLSTTKCSMFQWMMQGKLPLARRDSGSYRKPLATRP